MSIKNLFAVIAIFMLFSACEKDDFCTKETPKTPKLVLRFYDANNRDEFKKVKNLSVWAEGKDTLPSYKSVELDSIALPLNTMDIKTVYHLKMNAVDGNLSNNNINTLTITYETEDVFISRACGYRTIFHNVNINSDNTWFVDYTPTSISTIDNEYKAHVKVYY